MAVPNEFYEQIGEDHLKNFSFIGRGSFGDIFRARHQNWGTDVAIKFLNRNSSFTREELLNEARAMDKARFNYILRLYGLFVGKMQTDAALVSGTVPSLGLVMEYMENGNLSNLICQVPSMPWALRFRILYEIALAMNFLHNLNPPLLHLDLKPSNILLDGELHVRVSDFGLSKFRRGTTQQYNLSSGEEDTCGGTLEFMPPESFVDFHYKPAPSTDVYSYGILMWSVLSNQEPYHNLHHANLSSLIKMHIPRGQRPRTEDLEKQVDQVLKLGNLIDLMRRCWSTEKDQRPSFRDCREEMEVAYCCYKWKIRSAVSEVQDILMQNSSRTEAKVPSGLSSKEAMKSEDYRAFSRPTYGLEDHFQTLHLEETPSVQNEALPPKVVLRNKSSATLHRSKSMCIRNKSERTEQENPHASEVQTPQQRTLRGTKQRPRSDTFASPLYPNYPAYPHYPPPFYGPHQGDIGFAHQNQSFLWRSAPTASYGGVQISGNCNTGIQIGGGNHMHVEQAPQTRKSSNQ
ncbi:receptor-interacting serine/threonine-protein kinase 3 [Pantherophis guttatus]|uniref:Receptor-interacting serine/threonine-protein kinase 3 n=1 Tax=Pantherophis guttatus TaxID=94885 RepID=A0A6P9B845_PANGU|nr:receptor-interacting serine/threonine-protein kinase 3 [Pantherophis guttatus]XP_034267448.1 receptor-interacting serine/threonine-protein kinase 3 [Pantherophis guttatus]